MFEKQYQLITRDRGTIEGLVVGSFLSDLSLYMDYNKLKESDFIIDKCKFYFSLGKIMSKNYSELDDVSISNVISNDRELREKYKEYGGWETIKKAMSIGNANNIDAYIDELYKNNFLIKRGQREIFTRTIDIAFLIVSQPPYSLYFSLNSLSLDITFEILTSSSSE